MSILLDQLVPIIKFPKESPYFNVIVAISVPFLKKFSYPKLLPPKSEIAKGTFILFS